MKPSARRWLIVVAACLVVLLAAAHPTLAQDKTLSWHRWDSNIQINSDGSFRVDETFEIQFLGGPFTFGTRDIPKSQYEGLTDFSVREGNTVYSQSTSQQPNTFYVNENSDEYVITWYYPSTQDATRTFVVSYTVEGGLIINEEIGDRFFWKAVGPDHAFPIDSSTVTVHLPPGATVDTAIEPAMFGVDGSTYSISDDGTTVTYSAQNIPANQEFEVGVRFPSGYVPSVKPDWQAQYEREQTWNDTYRPILNLGLSGLAFLILIGGLFGVYTLWRASGRDPDIGAVPSYLTEPPSDLPPGLVGTLVDEKADLQDIMATMIDLARRGAIDMQEDDKKVFGMTLSKGFVFRKNEDFNEPLRSYESTLLKEMFGSKSKVELEDLQNEFYTAIPKLQKELYAEAVKEQLFPSSPKAVRSRWTGIGVAGLVISLGVGFCATGALADMVQTILCPFGSLGVASLALIIVGQAMPAKSRHGAEEAAKWRAFKEYLQSTERYTDLKEVTDQFDKYLPYAIAFGLERTWVNKFSQVPGTPIPRWYYPVGIPYNPATRGTVMGRPGGVGTGAAGGVPDMRGQTVRPAPSLDSMSQSMFSGLSGISDGLFTMLNSTSRTFSSRPSSSGSSGGGFSGGGFSGGGFSGGGGGGGGGAGFG
jgi:uncharacterized membrane protein